MLQVAEMPEAVDEVSFSEPFIRLAKDMKQASHNLSWRDARWLVDTYYLLQDARIRAGHQDRTSQESAEPHRLVSWVFDTMKRFEATIKTTLHEFSKTYAVGNWMLAQHGIGPVLSAAMLSHFDIRKAPTVGHFWRFAGLDPTLFWHGKVGTESALKSIGITKATETLGDTEVRWLAKWSGQHPANIERVWNTGFVMKGEKPARKYQGLVKFFSVRPWNARLKAICVYRIGETLVKFSGNEKCFYGRLMADKKRALWKQNVAGEFRDAATSDMEAKRQGDGTDAAAWKRGLYDPSSAQAAIDGGTWPSSALTAKLADGVRFPMLPPGQIHNRARRWAVKLFLSHLHHVMYWDYHKSAPPAPYIFEHPELGDHRHLVDPPLWPEAAKGRPLSELLK